MREFQISDLITCIDSKINKICHKNLILNGFNSIQNATKNQVTFCTNHNDDSLSKIKLTKSQTIICSKKLQDRLYDVKKNFIFVENPRLTFLRSMNFFLNFKIDYFVHPSAIIESDIPPNVQIGPHVFIDENVILNKYSIIQSNVSILNGTKIGKQVKIQPSSVIGALGFGMEINENNEYEDFPQTGGITIEDHVIIGSNCSIMKGTFDDTFIGMGSRIAHLVNIGHNVQIGKNCFLASGAILAGGSKIGDNTYLGVNCTIKNGITIGKNCIVGAGSVVTKNIPDNKVVIGIPGRIVREI